MILYLNNWIKIINNNFIPSPSDYNNLKCKICGSYYHKKNGRQAFCMNCSIEYSCHDCGKIFTTNKIDRISKIIKKDLFRCHSCNAKYNLIQYNKSELGREKSSEHCYRMNKTEKWQENHNRFLENFNKSERGKEIQNKLIEWARSKQGRESSRKSWERNCKPWIESEEGKNLARKIGPKNLNITSTYLRDENDRITNIFLDGKFINFEDYCLNFISNNEIIFDNDFKTIKFDPSKSKPSYPSLSWEQMIADLFLETPWLVYIKYYIDKNNLSRPLVVAKTGTLIVNKTGSDINFNYNINSASRQFLLENKLSWDTSRISIKGFKTENDALRFEKQLLLNTNLFS